MAGKRKRTNDEKDVAVKRKRTNTKKDVAKKRTRTNAKTAVAKKRTRTNAKKDVAKRRTRTNAKKAVAKKKTRTNAKIHVAKKRTRTNAEKMVKDAVHGNIKIPALCVAIMDTPQFQRLRDIKQLGGAPYVYPGGSHSRFEHSLGVCHLAGRLMKKLQEQQPEDVDKKQKISDKDVLCVQIAALCHDMGHGPFSHAFDMRFLPKFKVKVEHEEITTRMIDYMLETEKGLEQKFQDWGLDEKDKVFIKQLIIGSQDRNKKDGRGPKKGFLYEVVNNKTNGVDVDKWDYFVRDCHHLGIGTDFDYDRLIESSRVIYKVQQEDGSVKDEPHICWRDKEIFNVMQMFHTRYTLHKKVYQHRGIKAVEMMIMEALEKANDVLKLKGKDGKKTMTMAETMKTDDINHRMEAYSKLTDSVFYEIKNSNKSGLKEARELLLNIERRKLYMLVAEGPPIEREEKVKKGLKLMEVENTIKSELVKKVPQLAKIAERLRVQIVVFNLGMTKGGLYQFKKDSPEVATVAETKNFSLLGFPQKLFNEVVLQVYLVPSNKPEDDRKVKKAIQKTFSGNAWQFWEDKLKQLLNQPSEAAST